MICAVESWGILPYASYKSGSEAVTVAVLSLFDRGWISVHTLEPWTAPDGRLGATYGPPLQRMDVEPLLTNPDTWDDPDDVHWYGELTVLLTPTGKQAMARSAAERN